MAVATMLVLLAVTGAAPVSDAAAAGRIGVEGFSCVVGDNQAWGEAHRAGYNGVFLVEGANIGFAVSRRGSFTASTIVR